MIEVFNFIKEEKGRDFPASMYNNMKCPLFFRNNLMIVAVFLMFSAHRIACFVEKMQIGNSDISYKFIHNRITE